MVEFFYGAGFTLLITFPAIGICAWIISKQWKVICELNNRIQAPSFKEFAATLGQVVKKPAERRFDSKSWIGVGRPPDQAKREVKKDKPSDSVLGKNY